MSCSTKEIFVKSSPPTWGDRNVFTSSPFLPIFNAINAQRGGLHLFFEHHKQWNPPAKPARSATLSVLWLASLP